MMKEPQLTCVSCALPERVRALLHVSQRISDLLMPQTIDAAVYNDCQRMIRIYGATRYWTAKAMDGAAARGRLDIVKWLSVVRNEGCTIAAIDGATRNGHLKVVKWLCKHQIARCSSGALNAAAKKGHVDVVKWLCRQNRGRSDQEPYKITYGVQAIAISGDTGALREVLKENCSWYYVGRALEDAASQGLAEIVKLILTVSLQQSNVSRALYNAAAMGHVETVKLLVDLCSSSEIRAANASSSTACNAKISDLLRKALEARDVEEKWGYFRTQRKALERMKTYRGFSRHQDKSVSFCGLLRSW